MMQSLGGDDFDLSREDVELLHQLYYHASNGPNVHYGYARCRDELNFRHDHEEVKARFKDNRLVDIVHIDPRGKAAVSAGAVVQKALSKLKSNQDFVHALAAKQYKIAPYQFHELWKNRCFFNQRTALHRGMPYYHTDWHIGPLNSQALEAKWAQIYLHLDERAETLSEDNPSFSYCFYFGSEPGGDRGVFVRMRTGGAGDYRALAECDPKWYKVAHDLFAQRHDQVRRVLVAEQTL